MALTLAVYAGQSKARAISLGESADQSAQRALTKARQMDIDATGKEKALLRGHAGAVYSAAYSPDRRRIVTGSEDGTAKVWDARTGAEVLTLRGHTGPVRSAAFSPDASRIVTAGDTTARIWDARPVARAR